MPTTIPVEEHLPVSFLAALVMLVLGTQQTAMSFRREKVRLAYGRPSVEEKLRLKVALQYADAAAVYRGRRVAGYPQEPSPLDCAGALSAFNLYMNN